MKIKRFGEGRQSISLGHNAQLTFPGIVEKEKGEYVRWEDYKALLDQIEAIGAGGVSSKPITKVTAQAVEVMVVRGWIANDAYAMGFPSMAAYRTALLQAIDESFARDELLALGAKP